MTALLPLNEQRRSDEYDEFLESKRIRAEACGFDVREEDLLSKLFPFQKAVTRWCIKRGRAAQFADTGLGKTLMQLEWAKWASIHTEHPVLILAPLGVARQTHRLAPNFGFETTLCATAGDVKPGLNITNYEKLHHFDPNRFRGIVLDECFAPDTSIQCLKNGGALTEKDIKDVRIGDTIISAAGADRVADVHRREVQYAVKLSINARTFICSPNHPFFTRRGWVGAQDLIPGDEVMATSSAVRMVRNAVHGSVCPGREEKVLREILFSEMADEPTRTRREAPHARSSRETRKEESGVSCVRNSRGGSTTRTNTEPQPRNTAGSASEDLPPIERDEAQTFRAWWEWTAVDRTTESLAGVPGSGVDTGVCLITGPTHGRLSDLLQDRHRKSQAENRHRSGWILPQRATQSPRSEEGSEACFYGVESLEVLEPGHPELERFRDAEGRIYFYDLGATRHPSFSLAGGFLVHNSSILKSFDGKTRKQLTEFRTPIPYRLACSATPSPNDLVEITNHSEFLGIMSCKEVTGEFFRSDGEVSYKFRLKHHAHKPFFRWLASWAVALRKPSDLGFSDEGFELPPLLFHQHTIEAPPQAGRLFAVEAEGINEQRKARRETLSTRVEVAAGLANNSAEPWVIWCDLNTESEALAKSIPDAVEVRGSDSPEHKERAAIDFAEGRVRVIVSKPSIFGFGMNWQHCPNLVFVGKNNSYEQEYQAIRRFWRFGQQNPVHCHYVASEADGAIIDNLARKEQQARQMMDELVANTAVFSEIVSARREEMDYVEDVQEGPGWKFYLGDSTVRMKEVESNSVGLSVFSPPFPGMYVYSNTPRDLGNCHDIEEMIQQMEYMLPELLRVTMPGRSAAVHLCQMTAMKSRDGFVGLKDFRGAVIQAFERSGWIYYGEVTIDKDPQYKAIRSKDNTLLFKTLSRDSSHMRMALADYMIQFKKPGDNPEPIRAGISSKYRNEAGWITDEEWIEWAAPVWYRHSADYPGGIAECDVLNVREAKDEEDERHLCPLQLGVIERSIKLWSNPGDLILTPYGGIGSELYTALKLNRRAVGFELKPAYWKTGCDNCRRAVGERKQLSLAGMFE